MAHLGHKEQWGRTVLLTDRTMLRVQALLAAAALAGTGCDETSTDASSDASAAGPPLVRLAWEETGNEELAERASNIAAFLFGGEHEWTFGGGSSGEPIFGVSQQDPNVVVTIDAAVAYVSVANVRVLHEWPDTDIGAARARAQCSIYLDALRASGFAEGDLDCRDAALSTTNIGRAERATGATASANTEYRFVLGRYVDGVRVGNAGVIVGIGADGSLSSFATGGASVQVVRRGTFAPPQIPNLDERLVHLATQSRDAPPVVEDGQAAGVLALTEQVPLGRLHVTFDEWMYVIPRRSAPTVSEPRRVVVYSVGVGRTETRSRMVAVAADGTMEELSDAADSAAPGGESRPW